MMASRLAIGFILTVNSVSFVSATAYNNVSQRLLKISSMYCPLNHLCGVSASNANEERQNTSCCIECSCAEDCLKYGNCCPYKENLSNKISVLRCKETVTKKKIFERGFYDDAIFADYRIIDNCPTGENNITLVQMCKAEIKNALEDYVWVSDQRTGEIYQNKHCAICNGIEAYTPWRIRTTYRRLMLAETTNAIETILLSDVCDIINEPPESEQVRAELYRCYIPEYQQCNMTGQWLKYDREIDNACKQIDWLYFDFTLVLARVYGPEVYKNIFCYICNKDINLLHANETCPEDKALQRSGYETVFTALVDFEQYRGVPSTRDTVSECAVNEVLDIYTKLCRLLACPYGQTPYYGTCKSITKQTNGLDVATLFMLTEIPGQSTLQLSNFSWEGLESLAKNIYKKTRSSLGLNPPKCSYCDAMMYVGGDSDQNVTFDVNLKTTPECQLDFIMEQHNALMGRYINIKIGKRDNIRFLVGPRYRHTDTEPLGIRQIWVPDRKGVFSCNNVFTLDKDVYCPEITLNISEHQLLLGAKQRSTFLSYFDNHGSGQCHTTKVCLNTYLLSMKTSGCRQYGMALTLLLSMSIILITRLAY